MEKNNFLRWLAIILHAFLLIYNTRCLVRNNNKIEQLNNVCKNRIR